eukprot:572273-Amphidinium_carterae.1
MKFHRTRAVAISRVPLNHRASCLLNAIKPDQVMASSEWKVNTPPLLLANLGPGATHGAPNFQPHIVTSGILHTVQPQAKFSTMSGSTEALR